jgi:1,4-alpha-glucan branching enzyme
MLPAAAAMAVVDSATGAVAGIGVRVHPAGFFVVAMTDRQQPFRYRLRASIGGLECEFDEGAGRCRRLDALPRLQSGQGGVGSKRFWRPREHRGDRLSTTAQRTDLRRGQERGKEPIVVVCNFTPVGREDYRVGVPRPGWYRERINTDALDYAGGGVGNAGGVQAESHPTHGHAYSIHLRLPPLGALIFSVEP